MHARGDVVGDSKVELQAYGLRFRRTKRFLAGHSTTLGPVQPVPVVGGDGHHLHFPPGFVLRVPSSMMKLASLLEIPFARVVYGKYSVQLVVRSYLHIFLQVDQHGAVLDFVAYFDRQHREAKRWLEVVIRLLRICIRSELEQSGCKVHPLTGEAPCCCHYHQPVSPDVIDCRAVPLCPQCLLHATKPERHVVLASSSAQRLPHCKKGGHELGPEAMCFQMWREQELKQQQERQALELQQQQEVSYQQTVIDELTAVNRRLDWLQASSDQVKVWPVYR